MPLGLILICASVLRQSSDKRSPFCRNWNASAKDAPYSQIQLGTNGRFWTHDYVRVNSRENDQIENYGTYTINGDKLALHFTSASKTVNIGEEQDAFLKIPPKDAMYKISLTAPRAIILSDGSKSFSYTSLPDDFPMTVDGEATGIWYSELFANREELQTRATIKAMGPGWPQQINRHWEIQIADPSKRKLEDHSLPFVSIDFGKNHRFRTLRYEDVDRLIYYLYEGFGKYTFVDGKLTLNYTSLSKTPYHRELGPSISFLKTPAPPQVFSVSHPTPLKIVLSTNSNAFVFTSRFNDGNIKEVKGEAVGVWWNPHVYDSLPREGGKRIHRTPRR